MIKDLGPDRVDKLQEIVDQVFIPCNLNMSLCYLKLKGYSTAVHFATEVLNKDEKNIKALYRRGTAYIYLSEFEKAKEDLKLANSVAPEDKDVQQAFELLKTKKKQSSEKEKMLSRKILEGVSFSDGREISPQPQSTAQENSKPKSGGFLDRLNGIRTTFRNIFHKICRRKAKKNLSLIHI
eukprot:TRINITY_DN9187_c0_g1_i4.p1 TRINITY_DN9187_c0_g1~~TRINITY_DN9187_c0_g1_i4.p1  ORF type:complete len:181 (+),score=23.03 TRINITY_DN9187_c0_g1_i4:391-933(+)